MGFSSFSIALKHFRGVPLNSDVELKTLLEEFFESNPKEFYCWGIEELVERMGINNNGEYIIV